MARNNKTHRFEFRLDDAEFDNICRLSKNFNSRVSFIRSAVSQYDDVMARQKYILAENLYELLCEYKSNLAHIGSNLNQCTHRINELNVINSLNADILQKTLSPQIAILSETLDELLKKIRSIYDKSTEI